MHLNCSCSSRIHLAASLSEKLTRQLLPACCVWWFCAQLSLCGLGIIAPLSVAWSLVVGAVLSWGLLWPVLSSREGVWFPSGGSGMVALPGLLSYLKLDADMCGHLLDPGPC